MIHPIIVQEHSSSSYAPRTYHNAHSADLTVAFAVDLHTAGEKLTHKAAQGRYIGFLLQDDTQSIDLARQLYKEMKARQVKTLNIAGNGIYTLSKHNCSQEFINQFVYEVLEKVHTHYAIEKIVSGGQTGVDIAGAVAAHILKIPAVITLPKGFKQRFEDGIDIIQERSTVEQQIASYAQLLENSLSCLEQAPQPSSKPKNF